MIKRIVHSVIVQSRNEKLQFQIELPRNVKKVVGILPTIQSRDYNGYTLQPEPRIPFQGSLWLRCSDKRDVFYAADVSENFRWVKDKTHRPSFGFQGKDRRWILGKKAEFFSIEVSGKETIIEGYYEDHSHIYMKGYSLEIYIETEL